MLTGTAVSSIYAYFVYIYKMFFLTLIWHDNFEFEFDVDFCFEFDSLGTMIFRDRGKRGINHWKRKRIFKRKNTEMYFY